MSSRTRCFCDHCGRETPAANLKPVFTVEPVRSMSDPVWEALNGGSTNYRPLKLGDACTSCLEQITSAFRRELAPDAVERILKEMDQ